MSSPSLQGTTITCAKLYWNADQRIIFLQKHTERYDIPPPKTLPINKIALHVEGKNTESKIKLEDLAVYNNISSAHQTIHIDWYTYNVTDAQMHLGNLTEQVWNAHKILRWDMNMLWSIYTGLQIHFDATETQFQGRNYNQLTNHKIQAVFRVTGTRKKGHRI